MNKTFIILIGTTIFNTNILFSQKSLLSIETIKPKLFADLGKTCQTPDAMSIDKNGDLYLSVPNFVKHDELGSRICKFNQKNQPETWYDSLPKHPLTNASFPMGMAFGEDGNLYVADNQSSSGKLYQSRLIRIIIEHGKPVSSEIVVTGFNIANGVRSYKNRIYVSDSYFNVKDKPDQSGIYSFSIDEFKKGTINLQANPADPHVLCTFSTKVFNDKHDQGGVDGITFDNHGNLYAGNFGDGVISKMELDAEGKLVSQKIILDSDQLRCCDGIFYYEKTNSIYIANFYNNSIHQLDLNTNQIKTIWENAEDNGKDGLLDQPCDPIIYKGKLVVVNFDSYPGPKNKEVDDFHTLSVFELSK